jgi:diketogulonate reductase-like aldo/keto reductase
VERQVSISRRRAAKLIGATATATLLRIGSWPLLAAESGGRMIMRAIPRTGEKLPVIGLGSAATFDVRSGSGQKPLGEVLSLFVKHGGKLIDSSPMYGTAEHVIGQLAAQLHLRNSLFFATKVWTNGKQEGIAQMERSLDRFETKTIDLMQVHNLVDIDTQMGTLRDWKAKGRIRYTGITHSERSGFSAVEHAMRTHKPDFVQINYSLVDRGAAARILPLAQEMHMGVIINRPFGGGGVLKTLASKPLPAWAAEFDCRSWSQFLLKWIVAHPAVTCVIPATNNPQHLEDNMLGGMGRLPDAKTRERMASLFVGFA